MVVRSSTIFCSKIRFTVAAKCIVVRLSIIWGRLTRNFGLLFYKYARKPRMKTKWMIFARQYQNKILQQTILMLYSDESSVQQFWARNIGVLCSSERYNYRHIIPVGKHPPRWTSFILGDVSQRYEVQYLCLVLMLPISCHL